MPLRYRHGYAAVLHRGLPTGKINPAQEFSTRNEGRVRTAIQPRSTGFELAEVLRGFTSLVSLVHLPVSLAGPAPSGSSGASRRCRGCSPPDPVDSPDPAAPSFNHSAATEPWCGSHTHTRTHSASWRTVSHLHSIDQRLTAHTHVIHPRGSRLREDTWPAASMHGWLCTWQGWRVSRVAGSAGPPARLGIGPPRSTCVRKGSRCGDPFWVPSSTLSAPPTHHSLSGHGDLLGAGQGSHLIRVPELSLIPAGVHAWRRCRSWLAP